MRSTIARDGSPAPPPSTTAQHQYGITCTFANEAVGIARESPTGSGAVARALGCRAAGELGWAWIGHEKVRS
ncbi:hypothetical protein SAMD00023353_1900290 [Rosellinia necatrix]|uniref:Uncharacterized protein n=1 Tax=Rosellinia necatrix TaxID=77044 RepID=A0A1S8A7K3_ROSNE|nr:hypothetical protein SAMD00023353_1900290 [Rosellinia necatrix]